MQENLSQPDARESVPTITTDTGAKPPLGPVTGSPSTVVSPRMREAITKIAKIIWALRLRGDPMADELYNAMCVMDEELEPMLKKMQNDKDKPRT